MQAILAAVLSAGFVQVLESWKSNGFSFYDFKGPEKFGNAAQYEKFLNNIYTRCEPPVERFGNF